MRVADVFDANVMGRVAWVKRPGVCLVGGISVLDEIVDEPFIGERVDARVNGQQSKTES
jgi:hypothetical protein